MEKDLIFFKPEDLIFINNGKLVEGITTLDVGSPGGPNFDGYSEDGGSVPFNLFAILKTAVLEIT